MHDDWRARSLDGPRNVRHDSAQALPGAQITGPGVTRNSSADASRPVKGWADVAKFLRGVHEQGMLPTLKLTWDILRWRLYYRSHLRHDRAFDQEFGVDTFGVTLLSGLTIESDNKLLGLEYEGTPVRSFPGMLADLPEDLGDFVFVDFGSGKGRALLLASDYNFKKIIGVEFARELHAVAERNIAAYKNPRQRCFDIQAACMDAARFEIPDEECVFYFYYPFGEQVMSTVLDNVAASYARRPRRMYFILRVDKSSWAASVYRLFAALDFVVPCGRRPSVLHALTRPYGVIKYASRTL